MKPFIPCSALVLGLMALLGSCSQPIDPKPQTYSQLLTGTTQKSWRLVSYQIMDMGKSSGVVLITNAVAPCEADDQYVFYANEEHKFNFTNGPTKCEANEPDLLLQDTWTLVNTNATLEFTLPFLSADRLSYTIRNLTESVMTLEIYLGEDIDASYRFTFNSTTK